MWKGYKRNYNLREVVSGFRDWRYNCTTSFSKLSAICVIERKYVVPHLADDDAGGDKKMDEVVIWR